MVTDHTSQNVQNVDNRQLAMLSRYEQASTYVFLLINLYSA